MAKQTSQRTRNFSRWKRHTAALVFAFTVSLLLTRCTIPKVRFVEHDSGTRSEQDSGSRGEAMNASSATAYCGNGQLDEREACDVAIARGEPGACPESCDTKDGCLAESLKG